jgi:guanidinopropionase
MNPDRRLRPMDPSVSPRFGDVATLLRAPRVPPGPGIDIVLVGVPFDLGTNYRTGARGGPAAVREASRTIRLVHPTSRIAPFDLCEVADVGDVAINAMDLAASLAAIEAFFENLHELHATPITVGGDHTVPLPILRAIQTRSTR